MKQLTKNFHEIEFQSKDGSEMPENVKTNILIIAEELQKLRNYLGKPIIINSAYRSVQHNANVGGVYNSYHTKGMAVDIVVKGINTRKLSRIIKKLMRKGYLRMGGVGLYNTFVHYDIRGNYAYWNKKTIF